MNQTQDQQPQEEIDRDLGFGSRVAMESHARLLNRDGSFNVARRGISFLRSQNFYHWLLSMSWAGFFAIVILGYFLTNVLFALLYLLCGQGALTGSSATTADGRFLEAFFFSVQTLATIGYGRISPEGLAANLLVTLEALLGLLGFALATGLLFARFSRPMAKIIYSRTAVIAHYHGMTAFEFRIANAQSNQLIDVQATVTLTRNEKDARGQSRRKFYELDLERHKVTFMPLHWVIVHPISESSPLHGVSRENFEASDPEILILLTAVDETFSQTVHSRSSYKPHEIIWGAAFADMFEPSDNGTIQINLKKIHDIIQK